MIKKLLLPVAAIAALSASAADLAPAVFPDMVITGISPDGKWVASSDEYLFNFAILNLETGEEWWYGADSGTEDMMSGGLGAYVSNTGVVVCSSMAFETSDQPFYWENGEFHPLPLKDTDFGAYPQAITPDGSRIAGSVAKRGMSIEDGAVMTVPVVWNRNAQGGYDLYEEIVHPVTDWTGRIPQYILVDDISADGKVLAGDIVDYSGFVNQPVVFRQDDKGQWSYQLIHPELVNPNGVEFPTVSPEPKEPELKDYMTEDEYEAYDIALTKYQSEPEPLPDDFMTPEEVQAFNDAKAAYETDWENNPYPFAPDFMTEEEYAQYQEANDAYWSRPYPDPVDYMSEAEAEAYTAAMEVYQEAFDQWQVEFWALAELMDEVLADPAVPSFSMNSAHISPNGKYYIFSAEMSYEDPTSRMGYSTTTVPYLFDLEDGTYSVLSEGETNVYATMVTDEGYVLGGTPADNYSRNGVIAKGPDAPFVTIASLIEEVDPSLYTWIQENMVHEVPDYQIVFDEETGEYSESVTWEEKCLLGSPVANSDLSLIASWTFNNWDEYSGSYFYSYLLPINGKLSGVADVMGKADALRVFACGKGRIGVIGNSGSVTVYDVDGRTVFTTDAPSSMVSTGLGSGAYIVRATAADGSVVTRKVVF